MKIKQPSYFSRTNKTREALGMKASGNSWLKIPGALGKLWQEREELSFTQIRPNHIAYIFPLAILLILHDLRGTYFLSDSALMGSDMITLNYAAFAAGALIVLLFFMNRVIGGMRCMTAILVVSFALWLILPECDLKHIAMLVFQFGIGGCTIYAVYVHVFVLKNAERLLSMFTVALIYGLFTFLYHSGVNNPFLSQVIPGLMTAALAVCVAVFKKKMFPDNTPTSSVSPPKGIYIILICPFAFFIIDVFGENLSHQCAPGDIALRGIGTMVAVLLALIVHFGLRRSFWYMLNFFLVFATAGILLLALNLPEPWQTVGNLLFGIGNGIGYIMIFYIVGFIKRYRNDKFFWRITLATIGAIVFSVVAEGIVVLTMPGAMPAMAVTFAVLFLFAFQLLSPVIQRNVFASDWIDNLSKSDVIIKMGKVEQADSLENLGLSPREKEVAALLLQGYTFRQISGSLGIAESTVNGYSGTLYKKLGISSRSELFLRLRVPDSNGKNTKTK